MKTIRRISLYDRRVSDRYFITDSGTVYSEAKDRKVMLNGERRTITKHQINEAISINRDWYVPFKDWGMYCIVLPDGTVLRRLKTLVRSGCCSVLVHLADAVGNEMVCYVSRLVANTFISDVEGKEVHHKDQDRTNNNVGNLEVLSFEEHRGIGNHSQRHQL